MINIDTLAEQYYSPYDPEFQEDLVEDAVTGEMIDPEETPVEQWDGQYFTPDTFEEFVADNHDLLDLYLDDDDPLADYENDPAHMHDLVNQVGKILFQTSWRRV